MNTFQLKKQSGTTFVEILVSLVVVAIGIIGSINLQMSSIKTGINSQQRYQATLMAYDMAERMRANPGGVEAGHYDDISYETDYEVDSGVALAASDFYKLDVSEWKDNLSNVLPGGEGQVQADGAVGQRFTIEIRWTQRATKNIDEETDTVSVSVRI